ncbi:CotH kinase family protein [Microbacterium marinilacus]|uniref:CotH kinase family protein n=2 Tax=Microbacterium marinilacus TaxID=415209 RepID=A0ABP7BJU3_9MICO
MLSDRMRTHNRVMRRGVWLSVGLLATSLVVAGCSATDSQTGDSSASSTFFDMDEVHTIDIVYDEDDYQAMIDAYAETGDKDWITATVTIDGETFEDVGLRLKGNSSLRGLSGDQSSGAEPGDAGEEDGTEQDADEGEDAGAGGAPDGGFDEGDGSVSADDPAGLPWLIRLDKYVDGQEYAGRSDFVVRGNNSETSLNEAVALQVIEQAGVAGEQAAYTRLSVNGSDEQLRLVIDVPDDEGWNDDAFGGTGITYKADSDGDYSYRGDDSADYLDVFDVKFDADDLPEDQAYAPLIEFLDFINNASDEELASQLSDYLDVDSFADYLAVQDLVANSDDIDGPGNNSYLHYDPDTGLMTVVAWDQNLSYGGLGGAPGGGGPQQGGRPEGGGPSEGGMTPPEAEDLPDGAEQPDGLPTDAPADGQEGDRDAQGGPGGAGMGGENVLVTRFLENEEFAALYESSLDELSAAIYESGDAQDYLDGLVELLSDEAGDLVESATIESEADSIAAMLSADAVTARD